FPEDKLFTYSIGGMRPFSDLVLEFLGMAVPGLQGVVTGEWQNAFKLPHHQKKSKPSTKAELLEQWDESTEEMNRLWKQIPPERFMENDKAFGEWEGPVWFFIFYWIDNEIHHRGQAYVYLRSLGVEPPPFWDRS
ncbi:MAG: DinB family protein, partial [Chitinophagales bacterium]